MMQGHDTVWGWGGMWFGPLMMFVVPLLLVGLIIWAVRALNGDGNTKNNTSTLRQGHDMESDERNIDKQ